jgi:hypothetical protein
MGTGEVLNNQANGHANHSGFARPLCRHRARDSAQLDLAVAAASRLI